jgi:hypothetical protein
MKLDDDNFLELAQLDHCNYQMALYAMHLATGLTLQYQTIKAASITQFLAYD